MIEALKDETEKNQPKITFNLKKVTEMSEDESMSESFLEIATPKKDYETPISSSRRSIEEGVS